MFANNLQDLPKIVENLQKFDVETIEIYDDNTFKIGVKFFGDFLKDKGFFKGIRYALRFIPEFWMVLTGGVPKFVILAEFVGSSQLTVQNDTKKTLEHIKTNLQEVKSFIVGGKETEKYWDFRHDSFKLLTEHS